jgi:tRNA nucleotidyltransferase (CCA-adding enzyme)
MLMSTGDHPKLALRLIDKLGLYHTIYTDSGSLHNIRPSTEHWSDGYSFLDEFTRSDSNRAGNSPQDTLRRNLLRDPTEIYLAWLLVSLLPWGPLNTASNPHSGSKKRISPAAQVAKEGIKATTKITEVISLSFQNAEEISNLCRAASKKAPRSRSSTEASSASDRTTKGLIIRRWGSSWRSQVMLSLLLDIAGLSETSELNRGCVTLPVCRRDR